MKKSLTFLAMLVLCIGLLTGCSCQHKWSEATCTESKVCSLCEETEGAPLGHDWTDATCSTPKTCAVCGETEGDSLGHNWINGNCSTPKNCSTCGETDGGFVHNPGEWEDDSRNLIQCTIREIQRCTLCGKEIHAQKKPITSLVEHELFILTPNDFLKRMEYLAQKEGTAFSYSFKNDLITDTGSTPSELYAHITYGDETAVITFSDPSGNFLNANDTDTTKLWAIYLVKSITYEDFDSDKSELYFNNFGNFISEDLLYLFTHACDPAMDTVTFGSDIFFGKMVAAMVASDGGEPFGYQNCNDILYAFAHESFKKNNDVTYVEEVIAYASSWVS